MQKTILYSALLMANILYANQINDTETIKPMGNIYGSNGGVQKVGKFKFGIIYDYMTKNKSYNGDTQITDSKLREVTTKSTKIKFKYGFEHNIEASIIIPYMDMKWQNLDKGKMYYYDNSGFQDTQLMLRYGIFNQKIKDNFSLSVGFGIDLPTAQTDKRFNTSKGDVIIASKQLGTGSYDYIYHVGFTKFFTRSRIDSSIKYQDNTLGDNNYEKGDVLSINFGYNYAINKSFDLQLEVDAKYVSKDKENNIVNEASGGDTIYITPGIHYRIKKNLSVGMVVPIVAKRDMNYDSAKKVGGLSEDTRTVLKLEYTF